VWVQYRAQMDRAVGILNVVKADSAALDCGGIKIGQRLPARPATTGERSARCAPGSLPDQPIGSAICRTS